MNNLKRVLTILSLIGTTLCVDGAETESLFNRDWHFTLSDNQEYTLESYKVGDGWREVTLPHDWSVELPFTNDVKVADGATGYLPGGIGWYSKSFEYSIGKDQKCYLIFDGVYNNSEYWINGKKLGEHPYGYTPFYFDISEYLKPEGQLNQLMVRVNHSYFADSRWYTGSGIYRDVKLLTTDKLHIPVWGTYITTPSVSDKEATIKLQIELANDYEATKSGEIVTDIVAPDGSVVASGSSSFELNGGDLSTIEQSIKLNNPQLWDTENPNLYCAKSRIVSDGEMITERESQFGIRTILFDAQKGFFLNGESMKIKGVCLHHDGGIVGAAVPRDVWVRRLQTLKEGGCNAIRTSHNPCSEEFLDLCDQMGFLVQLEFFDEWDNAKDKRYNMKEQSLYYPTLGYDRFFGEWAESDVKNTMRRDRNRACIIQWSIGNEIEWTYDGSREATGFFGADSNGNYFWNQPPYSPERIKREWQNQPKRTYDIGRTAHKLATWCREMDTTRPVTANCILPSISFESGYIDALDVAGFSYRRVMYDYAHEHYPDKVVMGTENLGQWHEWKAVLDRDFVSGIFIWTGVDYMGERGGSNSQWPEKSMECGLLDLAGFEKPSFDMIKSLWVDEPTIAVYSQKADKSYYKEVGNNYIPRNEKDTWENRLWVWDDVNAHWNYEKGDEIIVEVYTNCERVELFQNGRSLGVKKLADFEDHIYKWSVKYKEGNITAKGVKDGESCSQRIETTGDAVAVKLTIDKSALKAGSDEVSHVVAQLVDSKGREVKDENYTVEFAIDGDCRVLGVDNGTAENINPFQSRSVLTAQGRCLMLIQADEAPSEVVVSAKVTELDGGSAKIQIK